MLILTDALNKKMHEEGINQLQLSQKINIKPPELCMILSGKRKPSLRVVKAIYRLYPDLVNILLA